MRFQASPVEECSESSQLVARAQAGESAAQAELMRRYTPRIAAFIRPIVGQPHSVEDVVQLVFIKAFRRLGALRDGALFESWLFALARNSAIDFRRRRLCRPILVSDEFTWAAAPDSGSARRVAEIMEALEHALRRLSPIDRSLVTLIVDGYSYRAVAAREGLSVGAVKVRLHRLRPYLRRCIGEAAGVAPARRVRAPRAPRKIVAPIITAGLVPEIASAA